MAFQLTTTAENLAAQVNKQIQIILEIEGIGSLFGAIPVEKKFRYDDGIKYDTGVRYDSTVTDDSALPYIELSKTTRSISQQVTPDKGGTTSISVMNMALIDKNSEVSKLISFNNSGEILSKKCTVYLNFKGGAHKEDSVPLYRGFISNVDYGNGLIILQISHPEKLKRQDLLTQATTALTADIDATQTTIPVLSTNDFIASQDASKLYIRIDEELMEVVNIIGANSVEVSRGQLNTFAATHDNEVEVVTNYTLNGNPLDLACKIMLSNEGNTSEDITSGIIAFNNVDSTTIFQNSVIYESYNIQEQLGLTVGDTLTISGSTSNDGDYVIDDFGTFDGGSYITLDSSINTEPVTGVTTSYKSQFNVLPYGLGMLPSEVDTQEHLDIRDQQGSNFTEYDFIIKEDISGKDFIDTEIYYPQGLYNVPRKARASVKLTQPPVTSEITKTIDESLASNLDQIKIKRSVDTYRYNEIVYNYNVDSIEDKYLKRQILISQSSKARVKAGTKQLKITSNGLKDNAQTDTVVTRISDRLNDRYKFGATIIKGVQVPYGYGYALEIGDVVPFGGPGVKFNSGVTGNRGLDVALYEVINKSISLETGKVTLDLLETNFSNQARYAVIGSASKVTSGSTDTELVVTDFFTESDFGSQGAKWSEFVGERVQVRNDDWSDFAIRTLDSISVANPNRFALDSALPFTPGEGYILEPVDYDDSSQEIDSDYKLKFVHINATSEITAVTDALSFDVLDGSKVVEGSSIYVHSADYTRDSASELITIDSVVGNTVTLDSALPFTPQVGDLLEASNYLDGGAPYVFI
jgi:hypothetical protein